MKLCSGLLSIAFACLLFGSTLAQSTNKFHLEEFDGGIGVFYDGKLVTQYLTHSPNPILWPLLAADGARMTRDYPMSDETADEKHDHPHHRSLWLTHGEVNGVDFWARGGGTIVHQEFTSLDADDQQAVIGSTNLWLNPDGETKVLSDRRRMTFGASQSLRWIDFDVELAADFGDVHFGDTKEGTFAVRVAESMKVDRGLGGKIVNSEGQSDFLAWGKPAKWVNYTGPIADKTYGIAMFCHPSSFNFPTRWHVRTYGLFAANPFGSNSFTGNSEKGEGVTLKQSDVLKLNYRVVLHLGIMDSAEIDELYEQFAKTQRKPL